MEQLSVEVKVAMANILDFIEGSMKEFQIVPIGSLNA